jgi:hypothetical protein
MGCIRNTACVGEMGKAYRIFVRECAGKTSFARCRHRWIIKFVSKKYV